MSTAIRGLRETELEEHAALVHGSYYEYVVSGERNFLADPHWWLKAVRADPYYRPEQTRVMVQDGRMVASVTNYDRWVHVNDGRRARVGSIGSVCTHPDFRRRGLVKLVLEEAIEWMRSEGFHWSSLFGREEVYNGSGWTILTSFNCTAQVTPRPEFGALTARPADPEADLAVLMALYDQFAARLTGPVYRSEDYWRRCVLPGRWGHVPTYTLLERAGEPVGYVVGSGGTVREVAWVEPGHDVLAFLLREAQGQPLTFPLAHGELLQVLREVSEVKCSAEMPPGLALPETYRGLWRHIGPGAGEFPEITDTASMKRFLRDREYCYWGADGY